jgi:hypothetical protein
LDGPLLKKNLLLIRSTQVKHDPKVSEKGVSIYMSINYLLFI